MDGRRNFETGCRNESVSKEGWKDGMLHNLLLPFFFWLVRDASMVDGGLSLDV